MVNHISCNCKHIFNSTTCCSDQKWNNDTCQSECKKYCTCKKDYSCNLNTCICEYFKYLKSIADNSVIVCDEFINATDSLSTNVKNIIPTNVANAISTNVTYSIQMSCQHIIMTKK